MAGARPAIFISAAPMTSIPVFDGHNDVLLRLWSKANDREAADFVTGDGLGHMDLPRMKAGHMAGGLFAIFVPSGESDWAFGNELNPPMAPGVPQATVLRKTLEMTAILRKIEAEADGAVRVCTTAADIRSSMASGVVAAVLHIEGAEAIGADFAALDQLQELGLNSLGLVWSRPNIFGHGVPFRYPSTGDTGDGLTPLGKELIAHCNVRRILIDLSHLNEKGFWDVARISTAPLVASHSNAFSLCASSRNLSDAQIRAVGDSGGLIGLNFATAFLRSDGHWSDRTPIAAMLRHLDHMIEIAGEDCVGLGSDFDGCKLTREIGDCAGLPKLTDAMRAHGYGETLMEKIAHRNWIRVLERVWGR
jgi:membrane dipeptidase